MRRRDKGWPIPPPAPRTATLDWRAAEEKINELPMFKRDIEVEGFGSLNMHYVHQRSEVESAIPLLLCHGCE